MSYFDPSGVASGDAGLTAQQKLDLGRALTESDYATTQVRISGSTTSTLQGAMSGFYSLNSDQMSSLQQRLYNAGYYDGGYYSVKNPDVVMSGYADSDTVKAFQRALQETATIGGTVGVGDGGLSSAAFGTLYGVPTDEGPYGTGNLSFDDILAKRTEAFQRQLAAGRAGATGPAAPKPPSPAEVKDFINVMGQKLTGADLSPDQQEAFAQSFYSKFNPGGGYQGVPPEVQGKQWIKDTMPGEYGAHEETRVADVIFKMLGGL